MQCEVTQRYENDYSGIVAHYKSETSLFITLALLKIGIIIVIIT